MEEKNEILGCRKKDDLILREEFLRTGKVPYKIAFKKGFYSLLFDPWLTVIKYLTGPIGYKLRQIYWSRKLKSSGTGLVIDPDVSFVGPENISIDKLTWVAKGAQWYSPEGYIKVGKRCHIGGWILGHGGVELGDYVGSSGIILSASDSHRGGYRMSGPMVPDEQRRVKKAKVTIGDDAFIGQNSIIMPGVTIGEGAIVGPNSLVVSDVEPWTVVMGSPAVMISKRKKVKFPPPD